MQQLGAEMYERLRTMSTHMQTLQRSLTASVSAYNQAVGLPRVARARSSACQFPELGVVGNETPGITELTPIEAAPRHLQAVELVADDENEPDIAIGLMARVVPEGDSAATP